jgi:hypothetical protein
MKRKVFSQSHLAAAIAAGLVTAPLAAAPTAAPTDKPADPAAAPVTNPTGDPAAAAPAAAATAADPDKPADKPADPVVADAGVVQLLQSQVKEKDEQIVALTVQVRELEARALETAATYPALLEIVGKSANQMRVAMGGTVLDLSAASATQVLADHKALATQFAEKFVAGGVAAVDAADSADADDKKAPEMNALEAAKLAAASTRTRK